jgi:phosphoglucomutase
MQVRTIEIRPYQDQVPGTSGLRKPTSVFQQPHYVESFLQAVFDCIDIAANPTLVAGGDGRYFNDRAIQIAIKMAVANGFRRIVVGRNGLLSTPAASHLIRKLGAAGGIVLSASHNPGGPDGDFGIKFNAANGAPAPAGLTERIAERARTLERIRIAELADLDLTRLGTVEVADATIEVVDPVADYATLMETLVDFDRIAELFGSGFRMRYDAMSAVTGPYAKAILEERLGAPAGTVVNGEPLPDFGGHYPDPNPSHAASLVAEMLAPGGPDFGAASDGDGDRNMVVAPGMVIGPSDSLAVLAANAHLAPGYAQGLAGVARSMPTSRAVDRVAAAKGLDCYVTPTGWKFFANLLDAGRITLCGEESAGTGSDHVREKDGLWAVLLWLNVLAARGDSADRIVREHWAAYGRDFYQRHDYEDLAQEQGEALMEGLRGALPGLPGKRFGDLEVEAASDFSYRDPVDGSLAERQGIEIAFAGGARAVYRLSGTGTRGATLRVYLERYEPDRARVDRDAAEALAPVATAAAEIASVEAITGRTKPTGVA